MRRQRGWWFGVTALVLAGFLIACGTSYNSSSDGLVLVASQGSNVIQSFSFSLSNGHIATLNNPPATSGIPSQMVLDPSGAYAYVVTTDNSTTPPTNSIVSYKVNSDGSLKATGTSVTDPSPLAFAVDTSGKFLFVAEGLAGQVNSYAISGGTLTAAPGTYNFVLPPGFQPPNFAAVAATPTTLPALVNGVQTSVCSNPGNSAPTTQYVYAADSVNNVVWEFQVDSSSGALTNPGTHSSVQSFPAASTPSGVTVDPCNRFVYASDMQSNQISGYSICNGLTTQSSDCPVTPDGSLQPIPGSPFALSVGLGPGPLAVDPFGNFLYVLDTRSNQVTPFKISGTGSLSVGTAASTGLLPIAITIRGDNNWLFVTNYNSATLSQFSIAPATGALSELPAFTTDNQPWGVAVK